MTRWTVFKRLHQEMWKRKKSYFVRSFFYLITEVLYPTMLMLLPTFLVRVYNQSFSIEEKMIYVSVYVIVMGLVIGIQRYLRNVTFVNLIMFRARLADELCYRLMFMDYERFESDENKKEHQEVLDRSVDRNENGVEGYMREFYNLFVGLVGFFVYCYLLRDIGIVPIIVVLVIGIVQGIFYIKIQKRIIRIQKEKSQSNREKRYLDRECIDLKNGKDIRMYNISDWFEVLYDEVNKKLYKFACKVKQVQLTTGSIKFLLQSLQFILIYTILFSLVSDGLSAESFLMIVGATSGIGVWIIKIMESLAHLPIDEDGSRQFFEYMETIELPNQTVSSDTLIYGDIRLEHVDFKYKGSDEYIFKDLNLHLHANEQVALVGPNGAGKTTLVKLLCGLYKPTAGDIYIDGRNYKDISKQELFEIFGVVFQDAALSEYRVCDNVACTQDENIDRIRVVDCLKKANVYDKISSLPKGIDTYMGKMFYEDGQLFSGGQTQKITLARALYKDAPVLLLDEPTAALDPIAERELYESYADLSSGKSSLFISHRLSSTQFCDRILYFENGQVQEDGTHETLMQYENGYSQMFKVQSKYYQEEVSNDEEYFTYSKVDA